MRSLKALCVGIVYVATASYANSTTNTNTQTTIAAPKTQESEQHLEYKTVLDDYKKYLENINQETRNEVVNFRKTTNELNQQKQDLYNKLSKEAQQHLKEERKFRAKLNRVFGLNKKDCMATESQQ